MVENQQVEDPPCAKFTWTIENFSRLNTKKHYSEIFVVGGYKWRVLIFPKGNGVGHLSMYLDVVDSATLPYGWSRYAQFSVTVVNQVHSKYSIRKDTQHQFNARESDFGFTSFMPLGDLYDPSRGYLVNDACVVEAEVAVHLYTIIKVARDEDLAEQIGRDRYFDLVDHDKVHNFRFQKHLPFNLFKEEVAKEFGIPVQFQRFWTWLKRPNNTYRPKRPLTSQEEEQSVGQIMEASNNAELKLFLEVELGLDLHPIPPPNKTEEDILLFFKLYDPEKGELRYVGRLFVKSSSMPIEILEKLNQMSGFIPDEEIELYEEIKFEPSVMCEHLDKRTSFRSSQIEDGDIICFQKSPLTESEEEYRYPDVPSFLEYVHNVVHPDGTVDRLKKEKLEKEKLEEEKKKKESEHRLMKEKEDKLLTEAEEHKRREEETKRKEEEERARKEEEQREQKELEERKEAVVEQKASSSPESNQDKDQAIQSPEISLLASVPPQISISDSVDKDIEEAEKIEKELSGMVAVFSTSSLASSGSSWLSVGDLSLGLGKLEELLEIKDPKEVLADPSLYSSFETVATLLLRKPEFLGQTKLIALRCFCYDLHLIQKAYTKSLELGKKVSAKEIEKKAALDETDGFITRLNSSKSSLKNMLDRKEKLLRELNQLEPSIAEARIQLNQILEEKEQVQRTSTSLKDIEASLQEAKQEREQELELIDDRWFNLRSAFKK